MSVRLEISSEIYAETDFRSSKSADGKMVSCFSFTYPPDISSENATTQIDSDGDLIVQRKKRSSIEIEHLQSTNLDLVGLQVWRGALLLADFLFHNRIELSDKYILEMGSGVGLTSIAASIFTKKRIICTDIDIGGILKLIRGNVNRNVALMSDNNRIDVMELNFNNHQWTANLMNAMKKTDVVLAADVIYDQDLTDAFVRTIDMILDQKQCNANGKKVIYIAMEKRYVFTFADFDTVAPCYEHFMNRINAEIQKGKPWRLQFIPIDFPQYFIYERVKELVLFQLSL